MVLGFGASEPLPDIYYSSNFTTYIGITDLEIMKLGLRGVSVMAATGDNGSPLRSVPLIPINLLQVTHAQVNSINNLFSPY